MQFVSAISSDLRLYAVSSSSRGITPRESEMAARDGGLMPFPLLFWSWITMLLICTDSLYFFFLTVKSQDRLTNTTLSYWRQYWMALV